VADPRELRLAGVRAIPLAIPLERPVRFATREVQAREYLLVRLRTEDGLEGVGYTNTGTAGARAAATFCTDLVAPCVLGRQAGAIEQLWRDVYRELLLVGRRGLGLRVLSAVDIALWDLLARCLGAPLCTLLGGERVPQPAYASGGYYRAGDDPERVLREELRSHLERGFRDVKIKVGGLAHEADVARVRAARQEVGADVRIALDANNAWRTAADAIRFVRAVEPFDPWWVEEPLSPDDVEGLAEVARAVDVPIATGEIHATRWDFRALILRQAADILQPDAPVVGGVSEWLRVARTAQTFDLPVAPHWHADLHIHLAAAADNCLPVEYFHLDQDIVNVERIFAERLQPRDGRLPIPDRPGHGIVLDEEAVERFALST
jgi:L-alanine-DL-glutamate epimerase-like enolase superfamily enzyme